MRMHRCLLRAVSLSKPAEENASDVAWKEVRELWQGPLTSGLEKLTVSLSEARDER